MSARKLARLALLTAVALSLFVVELQLPDLFPIPGRSWGWRTSSPSTPSTAAARARQPWCWQRAYCWAACWAGAHRHTVQRRGRGGVLCGHAAFEARHPGAAPVAGERVWRGAAQSRANGRGHGHRGDGGACLPALFAAGGLRGGGLHRPVRAAGHPKGALREAITHGI